MNLIDKYNKQQIETLTENKSIPEFKSGDTLKVGVRIVEGKTERVQYFQGLCIARSNKGLHSTFTVRKVSNGEGVERIFPLYSAKIVTIERLKQGIVRRAKLYYIRELSGKAARIKEKIVFDKSKSNKKIKSDQATKPNKTEAKSDVLDNNQPTPKKTASDNKNTSDNKA